MIPFANTTAGRELLDKRLPEALKDLRAIREALERIADAIAPRDETEEDER